jgi:murein DD-endopeptidase MepM/ murein hydrolase activator NlpD
VAAANDPGQVAYSLAGSGSVRELDVMSIRYGRPSPLIGFPPAKGGAAGDYLAAFSRLRSQSGVVVGQAPAVSLFGERASGIVSTEGSRGLRPATTIVEWVGQARSRIWIVRAILESRPGVSPSALAMQLSGLKLSSAATAPRRSPSTRPANLAEGDSVGSIWFSGSRTVTQGYGCTTFTAEPIDNRFNCGGINHVHEGIDFGYPGDCYSVNYGVYAGRSGIVDIRHDPNGYGANYPVVQLDSGKFAVLGHVRAILVAAGTHVGPGTLIAYIGSEGLSTGCHLHFEVDVTEGVTSTSVDPTSWLADGAVGPVPPFGDFDGDTRTDLVAVNDFNSYVMPSNGTAFGGPQPWSGNAFYGSRANLVGDVNDDGRSDLIAVNDFNSYVMLANVSSFGPPQLWSGNAFYGTKATLVGDVNGDGRSDLIAVNDFNSYVMLANVSSFGSPQLWSGNAFYGSRATLAGDVDGNGRTDLIAVNDTNSYVMLSNGSSFESPQLWSSTPFYGTRATLVGDVNGNGSADLIAVNDFTTYVMESNFFGFNPPALWSGNAFYGNRATMVGDVNGDDLTDLVAVNDTTTYVMLSSGSVYGPPQLWSGTPFYGTRATM